MGEANFGRISPQKGKEEQKAETARIKPRFEFVIVFIWPNIPRRMSI